MVDEPIVNYYGATVAAPYISDLLTKVLPYLGYEPSYTDEQLNSLSVRIGNYVGKTVKEAKRMLSSIGISADALGADENAVITAQSPKPSSTLTKNMGSVILYTDYSNTETTTVPDVMGKSVTEANQILISRGLNIKIEGAKNYAISDTVYAKATYQSVAAGSSVDKGSVITVRFLYDDQD
jgi:stage V sporulation protein D (sporulation-specific penicillin-binding protein)